jgi:hypothetical protein
MDYPSFRPERYAPDLAAAKQKGKVDLQGIGAWLPDRKDRALVKLLVRLGSYHFHGDFPRISPPISSAGLMARKPGQDKGAEDAAL